MEGVLAVGERHLGLWLYFLPCVVSEPHLRTPRDGSLVGVALLLPCAFGARVEVALNERMGRSALHQDDAFPAKNAPFGCVLSAPNGFAGIPDAP